LLLSLLNLHETKSIDEPHLLKVDPIIEGLPNLVASSLAYGHSLS
jgi:hypothetical protein